MNSQLVLLSRFVFVTTEEQAKDLLKLVEDEPEALNGLLIILDGNLVVTKRHAHKLTVVLFYLMFQSRKLGIAFLIVRNPETKLDKRVRLQLTHTSKIVSKEIKEKETRV